MATVKSLFAKNKPKINKLGGPDAYVAYCNFNSLPVFVAFGLYRNHISSNISELMTDFIKRGQIIY